MANEGEYFVDITRCSLCNETSLEPKRLPCFHIFCINCLETTSSTSRADSSKIQCPVCKTDFVLPVEGVGALNTDSFVKRLTTVNDILKPSLDSLVLCDACDTDAEDELPIGLTFMYCVNCCMRLCKYCCRLHERSEATRYHTLVRLRFNEIINRDLMELLAPNKCVNHTNEKLKLYCSDCKSAVCALCYMEFHQTHQRSELELVGNEFRIKIQNDASCISHCSQDVLNKIKLLQKDKSDTIRRTEEIKTTIDAAKQKLKMLVDAHADTLIQEIESLKDSRLAEIETAYEDFTRELSALKSYLSYAEELCRKGSPNDICQVVVNFEERLTDIKNISSRLQLQQVRQLRMDFKNSKLENILTTHGENSVGKLHVEADQGAAMQGEVRESWLEDLISKPVKLQRELNESYATINGLNSAIECLRQDLNSRQSVIHNQILELEKEKAANASLRSAIEQKNEELCNERATTDKKCKQHCDEIMKMTTSNMNLQKIIEKQRQELDIEKVAKMSLLKKRERLQKELEECRIQIGETHQLHEKQINELTATQEEEKKAWSTIADLLQKKINDKDQLLAEQRQMIETSSEKAKRLEEVLELFKRTDDSEATVTKDYQFDSTSIRSVSECDSCERSVEDIGSAPEPEQHAPGYPGMRIRNQNPVLIHTITSSSTANKSIFGVTSLGDELLFIRRFSSEIEVFDAATFIFKHKVRVNGLTNPQDIISCTANNCVYITLWKRNKYVMILDGNLNLKGKWSTGNDGGRLSLTKNSTIIVTFYETNQLREYTRDGELLCEVRFPEESEIIHPWHAVELSDDNFVVGFGCHTDSDNKVCIVDRSGNVLLSFGGSRGSSIGNLNCPVYLATDNIGNILVADQNNGRLLLLNPQLILIRELLSTNVGDKPTGRRLLSKFYFNEVKGRLLIADNNRNWHLGGQVLVFDFD